LMLIAPLGFFWSSDEMSECKLVPRPSKCKAVHCIKSALALVATSNLGWQACPVTTSLTKTIIYLSTGGLS
jgi:hypothetical protein